MIEQWLVSREKTNFFEEDLWLKHQYRLPRRPNLNDHRRQTNVVQSLIFMGATVGWVRKGVQRGWVFPLALSKFQKLKQWECADPAKQAERVAILKGRANRAARGKLLDLQTRWRGGFQWARNITEEWEMLDDFEPYGLRSGIGRTISPRGRRRRQANLLRMKEESPV